MALSITEAPDLIVVTKPSELISTDGKPDYATIEGTSLLYASNSEDDIVMDINTQQHYVLIAGRWNHSKTLDDGDWKFVEPEDLPVMWEAPELKVTRWGTISADFKTHETSLEGVYAIGDIVRGASLVVWAIKDGRDAADSIAKSLIGDS